jgi:pyruvate formate lyase activating enzyme
MRIAGFIKNSFVDFRGKVAAVIFTPGCNFDCYYCHNRELISSSSVNSGLCEEDVLSFIEKRHSLLDGIVISGGEPTLQDDLSLFLEKLKKYSLPIKLDTNGSRPAIIKTLIDESLVDYISMDIKAPFDKYPEVSGANFDLECIKLSIRLIMMSNIDYEFRTTVVPELDLEDLEEIALYIKGAKRYTIQQYRPIEKYKKIVDLRAKLPPHKPSFFTEAKEKLETILNCVELKGV